MIQRPSSKEISLVAVLLLAGVTALAQQPGGGSMPQQQSAPNPQQTMPGQPGAPGSSTPGIPSPLSSAPSLIDQAFVEDTLQNNQAQVQMSQLAQQKSASDDVKDFSQHMVQIHTQLDTQLKPIAKHLDVSESPKPSRKEKEEIARLEGLSGQDFDNAYLQAMAKEQQHCLKEFKNETESQNPVLQRVAKADEPVLSQNFEVLQKVAQAHNVTIEGEE